MVYVALVHMKVAGLTKDGLTDIKPGEPIPNFEAWDECVKRAHLEWDKVEAVDVLVPAPIPAGLAKKVSMPPLPTARGLRSGRGSAAKG